MFRAGLPDLPRKPGQLLHNRFAISSPTRFKHSYETLLDLIWPGPLFQIVALDFVAHLHIGQTGQRALKCR